MTIEELSSVLQMQEEILQFSSFTNADAWELGNLIVAEAAKRGAAVLVRIRLNNGYTVFPISPIISLNSLLLVSVLLIIPILC